MLHRAGLPRACSPAATRYAQELQGMPSGTYPRAPMPVATEQQRIAIKKALEGLGALR